MPGQSGDENQSRSGVRALATERQRKNIDIESRIDAIGDPNARYLGDVSVFGNADCLLLRGNSLLGLRASELELFIYLLCAWFLPRAKRLGDYSYRVCFLQLSNHRGGSLPLLHRSMRSVGPAMRRPPQQLFARAAPG